MSHPYDHNIRMGILTGGVLTGWAAPAVIGQEHDADVSAATVTVNLISSARLLLRLDSVFTEYSAQYLLDSAVNNRRLSVKYCLQFALRAGIPKAEDWPQKPSSSSSKPALVSMKGELLEAKHVWDADDLLARLPVAAKLHVFAPQIDLVGNGIYCGSSGEAFSYVGLRDVIIVRVEKGQEKAIAVVKLWYKNRFQFVKVSMSRRFMLVDDDESGAMEQTGLLGDFVAPRFSIN